MIIYIHGIKSAIKALQASHPTWTFKVEYTDLTWEEVINGEHQGHTVTPSNLVQAGSNSYGGLWICEICGKQRYDSGSWYCASVEALEYMMDVRNSLNETDLFQFMQLSGFEDFNNDTVRNTLRSMASSYSLIDDECIEAVISAANTYHVDPYYIMAKILEEQSSTSPLYTGSGLTDSKGNVLYAGYYNLLNCGAYSNTGSSYDVILNGLAYAANHDWTSKTASILGGVSIISSGYISKDQDTLYYQKFDVIGDSKYEHQYQQNVLGAQTAGTLLRKLYKKFDNNLSGNYNFIIPLYKNIPVSTCSRPATNQEHIQDVGIMMGDVNQDGQIGLIDSALMINHIRGRITLTGNSLIAAKVSGENEISLKDVAILVNVIRGKFILPSNSYNTGTITVSCKVRLSPNGVEYKSISEGASIKVLRLATDMINDIYWDLVVSSNGIYGYIPRNNYN